MNRIVSLALLGLVIGVLIGEFYPKLFADVFGQIGSDFAGPFSA